MKITKEWLLDNGFEEFEIYGEKLYNLKVDDKNTILYLTITKMGNMIDRDWNVQIDDDRHISIGSLDIQTVEHLNKLFDTLDFNFGFADE